MDLRQLRDAVRQAAGIRLEVDLQPPGGPSQKVFPPTYLDGNVSTYATEERILDGETVQAVLLDSIPSQANRLEQALLSARRAERFPLPLLQAEIPGHGILTSLDVPHRVYDAIFLDSVDERGTPYSKTDVGRALLAAAPTHATWLFRLAPTTLLFGGWNSHSGQGVGAAKFPRALVSEIIGWPVVRGVKTASRLDPLGIAKPDEAAGTIYEAPDGRWTFDPERAVKDARQRPKATKPSAVGHGNVAPSLDRETGGVSVKHVRQTAVLSLVQLRQLQFPDDAGLASDERDLAARTVLAALALAALCEQFDEGYQLRSGCLLQPVAPPRWTILGRTAADDHVAEVDSAQAASLVREALQDADGHGIGWYEEPITFYPSKDFAELIRRNDKWLAAEGDEEA